MQSLVHAFRSAVRRYPGHPAMLSAEDSLDYQTLDYQSDVLAAALCRKGVVKGDRIGLYCMNSRFFAIAYLGILKAGAVVVPLNLLINREEMAFILSDSKAKGLVFHNEYLQSATYLAGAVANLEFGLAMGGPGQVDGEWSVSLNHEVALSEIEYDPTNDLAVLIYTSGTTGTPKGAMLTHGNLLANTDSVRQAMDWQPGKDRVLVVLPMFHAFAGTVGLLTPLLLGCAVVPLPRFEPELVANTIHATQATVFLGVPSMYSLLARLKPERAGLFASLRACISGGAALPVEVLRRFEAQFGKPIYEGDGPTECSPVTCVNPVGGLTKPGTVGLPVPNVEMRIVGEQGVEPLPLGEVGEIAVRGPNVMKGYWNQPEATAEVFRDGWFLTGDLGTEDEDGYFSIVDRKKDLIIVNGMNVYPRMVEEALYRFPFIREAAVVAEANALHGEVPIAYVALNTPDSASVADVRAYCREHLGRHQQPRRIVILAELPKNATGKILKRELCKLGEVERGVEL